MRKIFGIVITVIVLISCKERNKNSVIQKTENSNYVDSIHKIANLIDSLYTVDQDIQLQMTAASKKSDYDQVNKLNIEKLAIFERQIPILKDIYNEIGYPTIELVGKENSTKFFTLVQHSDADVKFQEEMLQKITNELKDGNVSGGDYAYLTDRVQVAQGKPQIYGTQLDYNTDIGQAFPKNLIDSINVNKRRKEIGLVTIQEYLNKASKMHFLMNKTRYENLGITEPKLYKIE